MFYISLKMQSVVLFWYHLSAQCLDYQIGKAENCWHSVDDHCHDEVAHMLGTVSDEKATRTLYMNYSHNPTFILATMQDQQSMMLHWCSFSGLGREHVASVFACKGSQYLVYGCLKPIASYITDDARPKIVDAPLRLIFRMGQGAYCVSFCRSRQPIPYVWVAATNRHLSYPRCIAKNHWRSIDTHFQNGAVTVLLTVLPIKAANTSVMDSSNQINGQLPYWKDS